MTDFSCFYGVYNKKTQCFEDFFFYDSVTDLRDDLLFLRDDYKEGKLKAIPNYIVYPKDYDLYLLGRIYPDDFGNVNKSCFEYRDSLDTFLERVNG